MPPHYLSNTHRTFRSTKKEMTKASPSSILFGKELFSDIIPSNNSHTQNHANRSAHITQNNSQESMRYQSSFEKKSQRSYHTHQNYEDLRIDLIENNPHPLELNSYRSSRPQQN
ncbi:hypothetical protein A3Q56_07563 [Intoshia linei]|uniref:Uncharacterized protein n=1 Tax=Intoshia linei TaxID=1819745 RepID=A0A177ARX0_9BILA|nr:hypothetical protein A3Q56_07563 [Intoshia linei]